MGSLGVLSYEAHLHRGMGSLGVLTCEAHLHAQMDCFHCDTPKGLLLPSTSIATNQQITNLVNSKEETLKMQSRFHRRPRCWPRGGWMSVGLCIVTMLVFRPVDGVSAAARPTPMQTEKSVLLLRGGDFVELDQSSSYSNSAPPPPLEFAHGTTTLSFVFQGGIIAAVDSRASLGSFVGSKTTQKVLPVNSHILGTMAGGAADCMYWIRQLKAQALLHELREGTRMSVARASRVLSNILFEYRGADLSVGTMIMGFDEDTTGTGPARIFYLDNTGKRIEGDMFAVGSGSTFAQGILDTELRQNMSVDEAIALGIKAIRHATFRDAYSGGFINVYLITRKEGWRKVYTEDLARLV